MKRLFILSISLLFLTACAATSRSVSIPLSTGNIVNSLVYDEPHGKSQEISFVYLHGKWGNPSMGHNVTVASSLNELGYRVVTPKMHWSRDDYSLPYMTVANITKSAIKLASQGGKKVIIIGHSLGGSALFYIGKQNLPDNVIGMIAIAPGHLPHQSRIMQNGSTKAVAKAKELVKQGKGDVRHSFPDFNMGRWSDISMSPEVYRSYYDLDVHPDNFSNFDGLKYPVLVINGKQDKLSRFTSQYLWPIEDNHHRSRYQEIEGNHKSVNNYVTPYIIDWIKTL